MDLVTALRLDTDLSKPHVVSFTGGGGKTSTMYRLADELMARGARVVCTSTTRLAAYEVETTSGTVAVSGRSLPLAEIGRALDEFGRCLLVSPEIVEGGMAKYPGVTPDMVDDLAARSRGLGIDALIVEADGAKMLPLKAPAEHEPPLPTTTTVLSPIAGMDALGKRIELSTVHRPHMIRQVLGLDALAEERVTAARIADLLLDPLGGRKGLPQKARFLPILNKAEAMPALAGARIAAQHMAARGVPSLVASTGCRECEAVHERWGPVAAVVLAAGESSRLGQPKQLVKVEGEPLVVRAVKAAVQSGVSVVLVVTGAYAEEVAGCLSGTRELDVHGVHIVHNPHWRRGQSSSVHAALRALGPDVQAALFLPVDQPFVPPVLLRRLLGLWRKGWGLAAPSVDGQLRGAPALFDRLYWPELMAVRGDKGGRDVLRSHESRAGSVPADARSLRDVNTPSDLAELV